MLLEKINDAKMGSAMNNRRLYERDDLVWSGKSVFEPSGPVFPRSPNLEMMGQDAGATIYGQCKKRHGRQGRCYSSVSFNFEPNDKAVIDHFRTLVRGQSNDIGDNIDDFLNMMARTIIVDGYYVYELKVGHHPNTNEIVDMYFSHVYVPNNKIYIGGRRVVQLLPTTVAQKLDCFRCRLLDPSDTFIFCAPQKWKAILNRARNTIRYYDAMEYLAMEQFSDSMKSNSPGPNKYNSSSNLKMLARGISKLGWSRGLFQGHETDYYLLEQLIRWNEFCVDLRNSMINELERAICRIAEIQKSNCRLIVHEASDYSLGDLRKMLQEGKTSTAELVKLVFA
jgi:hypothetical protein